MHWSDASSALAPRFAKKPEIQFVPVFRDYFIGLAGWGKQIPHMLRIDFFETFPIKLLLLTQQRFTLGE